MFYYIKYGKKRGQKGFQIGKEDRYTRGALALAKEFWGKIANGAASF